MLSLTQFIDRVHGDRRVRPCAVISARSRDEIPDDWAMSPATTSQSCYYLAMRQLIAKKTSTRSRFRIGRSCRTTRASGRTSRCRASPTKVFPSAWKATLTARSSALSRGISAWAWDSSPIGWSTTTKRSPSGTPARCRRRCAEPLSAGRLTLAKHFNIERPMVVDGTLRNDEAGHHRAPWRCDIAIT